MAPENLLIWLGLCKHARQATCCAGKGLWSLYVCWYVRTNIRTYVRAYVRTYVRTYVCMYVCVCVCM